MDISSPYVAVFTQHKDARKPNVIHAALDNFLRWRKSLLMPNDPTLEVLRSIRAEMARQELRQSGLAERLGVSPTWVSNRLSRTVEMTLPELARIAAVLGVDWRELLAVPA